MANPNKSAPKPAPKLQATRTRPPELAKGAEHDERVMDEAEDESFPASDPPSTSSPGGSVAVRHAAQEGRKTPEPDAKKLANKTPR